MGRRVLPGLSRNGCRARSNARVGCLGLSLRDGSQSFGGSGQDGLLLHVAFQREVVACDPGGIIQFWIF